MPAETPVAIPTFISIPVDATSSMMAAQEDVKCMQSQSRCEFVVSVITVAMMSCAICRDFSCCFPYSTLSHTLQLSCVISQLPPLERSRLAPALFYGLLIAPVLCRKEKIPNLKLILKRRSTRRRNLNHLNHLNGPYGRNGLPESSALGVGD